MDTGNARGSNGAVGGAGPGKYKSIAVGLPNTSDPNYTSNNDDLKSTSLESNDDHIVNLQGNFYDVACRYDDGRNSSSDSDSRNNVIGIGELTEPLNSELELCWSCLIPLSGNFDHGYTFLYSTHTHPLLNFAVCSTCVERATAVESDVIDLEIGNNSDSNENSAAEALTTTRSAPEMNACSWCGLEDDELGENDDMDEIPKSDLILCEKCPRAFCVRCAILSFGGDQTAWETVRHEILESDKEWVCCHCHPTHFLEQLQAAHEIMAAAGDTFPNSSTMNDNDDSNHENSEVGDLEGIDHDESVEKLLQELDYAEHCLADATHRMDEATVEQERERIELELIENGTSLDELESSVQAEVDGYMKRWMLHFDRFSDTVSRLQDELDSKEVGVMEWYYKCRDRNNGVEIRRVDDVDDVLAPKWKIAADLANGECVSPFSHGYQPGGSHSHIHPNIRQGDAMKRKGIARASSVVHPVTNREICAC